MRCAAPASDVGRLWQHPHRRRAGARGARGRVCAGRRLAPDRTHDDRASAPCRPLHGVRPRVGRYGPAGHQRLSPVRPRAPRARLALHTYHLVPYPRTAELLGELQGNGPSAGSLVCGTREAATAHAPLARAARAAITASLTAHADETSLHVAGRRWWLHVAATATHTHLHVYRRRGLAGMEAAGVWTDFRRDDHARRLVAELPVGP